MPAFRHIWRFFMSSRLEMIASFVTQGRGVADIGTDHAILPIILRRRGYKGYIVAGDINEGPLKKAERGLLEAEIDDVELKLCNGLESIDGSRIDTIVVAGMGGDTITGILDRGLYDMPEWADRSDYKLILHPVTKPEILRYWLVNNGFRISGENYIEDNGILCQIICAEPGESEKYMDSELYVGKLELIVNQPCFEAVVDKHIKRFKAAVKGLENASDASLAAWKKLIENMISELERMKGAKLG